MIPKRGLFLIFLLIAPIFHHTYFIHFTLLNLLFGAFFSYHRCRCDFFHILNPFYCFDRTNVVITSALFLSLSLTGGSGHIHTLKANYEQSINFVSALFLLILGDILKPSQATLFFNYLIANRKRSFTHQDIINVTGTTYPHSVYKWVKQKLINRGYIISQERIFGNTLRYYLDKK